MSSWRDYWWKEQFNPSWIGIFINPFYLARRGLLVGMQNFFSELRGDILDVGCGRKPYRAFLSADRYVGLDVDTPTTRILGMADVFYDGSRFPFADESFDAVLCSQVFEHVFKPEEFLLEIRRVLRPGGKLLLTVPFVWDEHEQPCDFARYTSFGLRALLEQASLEIIAQVKSRADASAVAQLLSAWLFKTTRTRWRWINLCVQIALIAPVNIAGAIAGLLFPANRDFYIDNIVLARKPSIKT